MKNIAINGFGRIGRLFFREVFDNKKINVVAINDLGDVTNLAYLLKFDSVYGKYAHDVRVEEKNGNKYLVVDKKEVLFLQEKDPLKLPWKNLNIDVVVESTGVFESYEKAKVHIDVGAKRVVITAPAKDADGVLGKTILMGINDADMKDFLITSNASCTTNATSPVIQILHEAIGVQKAALSTVHAYTATQTIVDGPVKGNDFRRGRAAAQNIAPSTTGAAIAVTRILPELEGKFDGIAMRVPVVSGSLVDLTLVTKRKTTMEEINNIFLNATKDPKWEGIFTVTNEQVVSSDIVGEPYGAIVDLMFTKVIDGDLVKVFSWYDNEAGYVATLLKHVLLSSEHAQ
ncbi:MAG: type I glyceraldehyde-3-phosphate dehydrogenase [Patescibacteria group bacterium]